MKTTLEICLLASWLSQMVALLDILALPTTIGKINQIGLTVACLPTAICIFANTIL